MTDTVPLALTAGRYVPFVYDIDMVGLDLTGATFASEVRDRKNGGNVRATLATVASEIEGIRLLEVATADADDVTAYAAEGITIALGTSITRIRIRIAEATMEAMDLAEDNGTPGEDASAFWDMHITPSGGDKYLAFAGRFYIIAGATI